MHSVKTWSRSHTPLSYQNSLNNQWYLVTNVSFAFQEMATVTTVVIPAELSTMCHAQHPQIQLVIFQHQHAVYTTKSPWLISTIHDFSGFPTSLNTIKANLDNIFTEAVTMLNRLIDIAKSHKREEQYKPHIHLFKLTCNDILHMYTLHRENNKHFLDLLIVLDPVGSRNKRTLLPLWGFIKSLFGTASSKEVQKIKKIVQDLGKRHNDQGALLSEALSLINITRVDVGDNRHAINDLINATDYLLERTKEIKHIKDELNALRTFVISHTELNLIVTELRDNINKFRSHLENLELTLDTLGLNKLAPSGICPIKLQNTLLTIQNGLPRNLQLPVDLSCESFVVAHTFSTVTMVPLLDANSRFNLFELNNLAIPDTSLNLSVSYTIESKFIAISESSQHFALLSDQDYYKCSSNYNHYNSFASPLYLANHHESCVMALYRKSNNESKQFCQVQFSKHVTFKAVYLGKGL